jgi:predicted dehydrogenase
MLRVALIGAGSRGRYAYGTYAQKHPNDINFIAVADPNEEKRKKFSSIHNISEEYQFESWDELLAKQNFCDAIIISTPDRLHFEPAMKALAQGYHGLLEKPISPNPLEVLRLEEAAANAGKLLLVGHVLRYTSYFRTLKQLLDSGAIGSPVIVQWNENVGYWHFAHSYVRGNWRNTAESSPILLAKCCHDIDLLHWLLGSNVNKVSSSGSLAFFNEQNAPVGSTLRCTDGCAVEAECPYSAIKWYYNEKTTFVQNAISVEPTLGARLKAIQEGPYGRCVYRCDNDVVDHQVVNFEFNNGVTVSFSMSGLSSENTRTFKIMGTKGEIRGHLEKNELLVARFDGRLDTIRPESTESGHSGGDEGIMQYFVKQLQDIAQGKQPDSVSESVQGHLSVFAAEHARITGETVRISEYIAELRRGVFGNLSQCETR